jgi:hypothetical protein
MNLKNLIQYIYLFIYVHKLNAESNNVAKIIEELKEYNEPWKYDIHLWSQAQYWYNMARIIK